MLALLLSLVQSHAPMLESLTMEAAPIALVRVDELKTISQINGRLSVREWPEDVIRIARCKVERMLLGSPTATDVFVALRVPQAESYQPAIGERFLVFLDREPWRFRPSVDTKTRLDRFSGGAGVQPPLAGGLWRVLAREGRDVVEVHPSVAALPAEVEAQRVRSELPLAGVLEWIDRELDRTTPCIEADVGSTAPNPWRAAVYSDGSWATPGTLRWRGDEREPSNRFFPTRRGAFEPDVWSELRQLALRQPQFPPGEALRFAGPSGPCASYIRLRIRRRDGDSTFELGTLVPEASPELRDAMARARHIWDALHERTASADQRR